MLETDGMPKTDRRGEWFIRTRYNGASHGAQELLPVTTLVHVKPEHPLAGSSLVLPWVL